LTSPPSSGGSGVLFEGQVGASYPLSSLLEVDGRGLPNCRIENVQLQRGEEGHPLDDVIIHGQEQSGNAAILDSSEAEHYLCAVRQDFSRCGGAG
jgi:hypothetical protein